MPGGKAARLRAKISAHPTLTEIPGGGCWLFLLPGGRQDAEPETGIQDVESDRDPGIRLSVLAGKL